MLNRILFSPDAAGSTPNTPHLDTVTNAKAVGGGLEPGSTDFGSGTAAAQGGRTGTNSDSGRSYTGNAEAYGGGDAIAGAMGNDVTATGRPLRSDARSAIGGAALSGGGTSDLQQDAQHLQTGGTTRSAVGPSGIGNLGGGTAGTGAVGPRQRSVDMVEGRVAGPPGALAADAKGTIGDPDIDPGQSQVPDDGDEEWRRAGGASPLDRAREASGE